MIRHHSFPYLLSLLLLCLLSGLSGCNRSMLNSLTTIAAGKQFELGGNQRGAFTVRFRNVGPVPVTLRERRPDGTTDSLGTFRPGQGNTLWFSPNAGVLIANVSAQPAQVSLTVTGDKNLSMRNLD